MADGTTGATVAAVYADGGVIHGNPSHIGGMWAWRHVDAEGNVIAQDSGITHGWTTNNQAEFIAAVRALEALPNGWSGKLCLDSRNTLGRLCWQWKLKNLPAEWTKRGTIVLWRLGKIEAVQLKGHPSTADLEAGHTAKGELVSIHNQWCDHACNEQAARYLSQLGIAS